MANSRWNLLLRMEEGVVLPVKKDWIRAIGVWHLNISKMTSCCRGTMDMFLHLSMNPKKNQEPKKTHEFWLYIPPFRKKENHLDSYPLKGIISLKTKEQLVPCLFTRLGEHPGLVGLVGVWKPMAKLGMFNGVIPGGTPMPGQQDPPT